MKQMGKKQLIGGPLTAVLAVAAGYLFGLGPAVFVVGVGLVNFFLIPLGFGRKASGSVGTDDSYVVWGAHPPPPAPPARLASWS